jgi:hypothetical protein
MTTPIGLAEGERLVAEATPLPWAADPDDRPDMEWNVHIYAAKTPGDRIAFMSVGVVAEANAALIVAAVNAFPAYLKLASENARLREALGKIWEMDTHVVWSGGSAPEPMYDESGAIGEIAAKALAAEGGA